MKKPIKYSLASNYKRAQCKEEYIKEQGGKCWYCDKDLAGEPAKHIQDKAISLWMFSKGFFENPIHLHHDHTTDLTIGAVHARCNAVLWEHFGQ